MRSAISQFAIWNRKLHYYLGLYFPFFIWLFSFTGLLLNHSWKFAEFWLNRKVLTVERRVQPPPPGDELQQAQDLMRQLGIRGEVEGTTPHSDPSRLSFRASQPGHISEIKAVLSQGRVTIEETRVNA